MKRKFYLNKRDGKVMGVCAGLADYTGIDALWIRISAALLFFAGVGSLLIVYLIVGIAANDQPDRISGESRSRLAPSERTAAVAEAEHYYNVSNPRLSREIDALR